jgi:Glutathione S-transferase, N-terminal domain
MKLYICYGTFPNPLRPGNHPCRNAYDALREAGHDPELVKTYGLGGIPDFLNTPGRSEVKRLSGSNVVPVLVTDDGEVVRDSKRIVEWARENPAGAGERA